VHISSRTATDADLGALESLYRALEAEQGDLKPMWPVFDGLDGPITSALSVILDDDMSLLIIGEIDEIPVGLLWARSEAMLHRAGGERVGVFRLIYTDPEARGVGVGESMMNIALSRLRGSGHRRFDARVSPGHRMAKNFFEQNSFAARLIVMYHEDEISYEDD
jgi:GNAT superfamily N-acetyltransferase